MKTKIKTSLLISGLLLQSPAYSEETTELDCLIKPEMYIDVSSPVEGVIASILVKKSDRVKKGQVLVKLENALEQAKVDIAQHETLMENQIKANKIRLDYAIRKEARVAGLKDNALSEQEYDDATTEVLLAKTELLQTQFELEKNKLDLSLANVELSQKTILSPITGIVVDRYLMPGESTNNQAILQLAKIDPLLVEVVAPYELFGLITPGMTVNVSPDIPADTQFKATVSIVDRIIDAASGSFSIRLALPNPDKTLIGGTKCIAQFPVMTPTPPTPPLEEALDELLPEDIQALLLEEVSE